MNNGAVRSCGTVPIVGTPIVQSAPTPADKPTAAPPPVHRFGDLLRRNRAEAPKPATSAPMHAPRDPAAGPDQTGDTSAIEAEAAPANAAKARAAMAQDTSDTSVVRDGGQASERRDPASGEGRTDDDDRIDRSDGATATLPPADRLIDARSAAQAAIDALRRLASTSSPATDDARGPAGEDREATAAGGAATRSPLGHFRGTAPLDAANDRHASLRDASRDGALPVAPDARFLGALGKSLAASEPPAATPARERALDALTASLGVGAPPLGGDAVISAHPPAALALPTAVDAPDFAAALGVQVSVLVRDGVQQAELHLNPTETGPVSIHITLDGTAARVDFGADVAATRDAIERGLPELASALRDAGFTLAGGGVSQHAGGRARSDEAGGATARGAGSAEPLPPVTTPSRTVVRTITAGGVDLYA